MTALCGNGGPAPASLACAGLNRVNGGARGTSGAALDDPSRPIKGQRLMGFHQLVKTPFKTHTLRVFPGLALLTFSSGHRKRDNQRASGSEYQGRICGRRLAVCSRFATRRTARPWHPPPHKRLPPRRSMM